MKTKFLISSIVAASLFVTACGGDDKASQATTAANENVIKVGVCPGPYGDMVETIIAPLVAEEGYKLETVTFSDYVQPNLALDSGDIQANLFQHQAYFDNFVATQGAKLKAVINVPTLGMGVFSDKVTSYEQLKKGDKAVLPNDPINLGRALNLAEKAGLIEIKKQSNDDKVSLADITSNKYGIEFVPMDAAQITRSLDSVTLGFVPGNYAFAANFDFSKALSFEEVGEPVKNIVAVKDGNTEYADLFYKVVHSQKFKDAIVAETKFDQFTRPAWWDEVTADTDADAAPAEAAQEDADTSTDAAPAAEGEEAKSAA